MAGFFPFPLHFIFIFIVARRYRYVVAKRKKRLEAMTTYMACVELTKQKENLTSPKLLENKAISNFPKIIVVFLYFFVKSVALKPAIPRHHL